MNKFYGNNTDTFLSNSKGIFLIASQDRDFAVGEYERIAELPKDAEVISPEIMDHDLVDGLPEEIFD